MTELNIIEVERRGVLSIQNGYGTSVKVNDENLIDTLEALTNRAKPKTDGFGNFAARIKIEIEFLGDMETNNGLSEK